MWFFQFVKDTDKICARVFRLSRSIVGGVEETVRVSKTSKIMQLRLVKELSKPSLKKKRKLRKSDRKRSSFVPQSQAERAKS